MKRYNKHLYILLFTFFLFSCTQDEVLNNGNNIPKQKGNTETLYFNIAIPQMNIPKLRSNDNSRFKNLRSENNNEKKIEKLSILFFKNDANKKKIWVVNDVNYNTADASYSLPFNNEIKQKIFAQESNPFIIYVLANWNGADFSDASISNESDFLNMEISSEFNNNGTANQTSFVMMARKEAILKISNTDLGEFALSRLANKIVLKLQTGGELEGATEMNIKCSLFNNNKKRKVGAGEIREPFNNENIDVATTIHVSAKTYQTTAKPFYSYPFKWENDLTIAPYFDIQISLKLNGEAKNLNYKVPITAEKSSLANHCYEVSVKLNKLAETDVELPFENINYQIVPWAAEDINISIDATHYLVVTPLNSKMLNKNSTTLYYSTSTDKSKVIIKEIKATYEIFNETTGEMDILNYENHNVNATVNPDGSITVISPIPTNNVPKEIYFTVSNGIEALNQKVYIRQTGATYITSFRGVRSSLATNGKLDKGLKNRHMYFVRTVVPSDTVILGYPAPIEYKHVTTFNGWRLRIDNRNFTDEEKTEIGNMISPAFILASQLGATHGQIWQDAKKIMDKYWEETKIGGKNDTLRSFRMPTKSEIAMMNKLQDNTDNIVDRIMTGKFYWTLVPYQREKISNPDNSSSNLSSKEAHTRLVKDIKGIQVDDI